jgi:pyruvyltransferase
MTPQLPILRAFWCRVPSRPNFGDALTPWLIHRLTGAYPRFAWPGDPAPKFLVCGSVIAFAGQGCTVWGAGLMNRDDPVSPAARYLAVRGPRTRARALDCGADCPPIYGDPALLLPRLWVPQGPRSGGPGFVAHFSDRPRLDAAHFESRGVQLLDIQDPVEEVIRRIVGCDWILSSSLHGLIVAHAYGVPAVWVRLRDLPSGDGTKFADHFESLGCPVPEPVTVTSDLLCDLVRLEKRAWRPERLETTALWNSCPFLRHEP